jgi:hypothetical protein
VCVCVCVCARYELPSPSHVYVDTFHSVPRGARRFRNLIQVKMLNIQVTDLKRKRRILLRAAFIENAPSHTLTHALDATRSLSSRFSGNLSAAGDGGVEHDDNQETDSGGTVFDNIVDGPVHSKQVKVLMSQLSSLKARLLTIKRESEQSEVFPCILL